MTGYAQFVTEWVTPSPTTAYSAATLLLLCAVAVIWAKGTRRPTWPELLLWLLALSATLMYTRTVAVGAIVVTPLAARAMAPLVRRPVSISRRAEATMIGAGFAVFAMLVALLAPSVASRDTPYPTGLDRALSRLPADTGVLNEYALGGWLLWTHPELDPYIDGRADVYSVAHFEKVDRVMRRTPGWYEEMAEDQLGAALLREDNPVAACARGHSRLEGRGTRPLLGASRTRAFELVHPPDRHLDA